MQLRSHRAWFKRGFQQMKHVECGLFRKASDGSQAIVNIDNRRTGRSAFKLLCFFIASCCALLGFHEEALAQSAFIFPSTVQVAGGSLTESVTVTIQSAGNLAAVHVVTQGAANLDFNGSGSGSCITASYVQGQTCAVSVIFTPKYPGVRIGAILLIADDGHVMATQYISAAGIGGLSVVVPGQINTVVGDGCLSDSACPSSGGTPATQSALKLPLGEVTDATGNLYVSDTGGNRIRKIDLTEISQRLQTIMELRVEWCGSPKLNAGSTSLA